MDRRVYGLLTELAFVLVVIGLVIGFVEYNRYWHERYEYHTYESTGGERLTVLIDKIHGGVVKNYD